MTTKQGTRRTISLSAIVMAVLLLPVSPVRAQQIYGVPGSPNSTEFSNSKVLPAPAEKYRGVVNRSAAQSKPWWPSRIVPPKGAPNVLLIMTDDAGRPAARGYDRLVHRGPSEGED